MNKENDNILTDKNFESFNSKDLLKENQELKKTVEILEKELFKSQINVKKLESGLRKSMEFNATNGKNLNNTSISFFLPSEFKVFWEKFLNDLIMNAFENSFNSYITISYALQETFLAIYNKTKDLLNKKIKEVLKVLNIENKESQLEVFLSKFRNFFQENFTSIFSFTEDFYKEILQILENTFLNYQNKFTDTKIEDLINDLQTKQFKLMCEAIFKISVYMLLHDPILIMNISKFEEREMKYQFYSKEKQTNIEGFPKEGSVCAILLGPPSFKTQYAFQGLKPPCYIVANPSEEMIEICQKQKLRELENLKNKENLEKKEETTIGLENIKIEEISIKEQPKNQQNDPINISFSCSDKENSAFDKPLKVKSVNDLKIEKKKIDRNSKVNIQGDNLHSKTVFPTSEKMTAKVNYRSNSDYVNIKEFLNLNEIEKNNKISCFSLSSDSTQVKLNKKHNYALKGKKINEKNQRNIDKIYKIHAEKHEAGIKPLNEKHINFPLNRDQKKKNGNDNIGKSRYISHEYFLNYKEINRDKGYIRKFLVSPDNINNPSYESCIAKSSTSNNLIEKTSPRITSYIKNSEMIIKKKTKNENEEQSNSIKINQNSINKNSFGQISKNNYLQEKQGEELQKKKSTPSEGFKARNYVKPELINIENLKQKKADFTEKIEKYSMKRIYSPRSKLIQEHKKQCLKINGDREKLIKSVLSSSGFKKSTKNLNGKK